MIKATIPLFETPVWLYVGLDEQAAFARMAKKHGADEDVVHWCLHHESQGKQTGSLMWLKEPTLKHVAHEVSHLVDDVLVHVGADDPKGEVRAYMMGHLIDYFWTRLEKLQKVAG